MREGFDSERDPCWKAIAMFQKNSYFISTMSKYTHTSHVASTVWKLKLHLKPNSPPVEGFDVSIQEKLSTSRLRYAGRPSR